MTIHEPKSETPYSADETAVTPWAKAVEELERGSRTYWLATVREDGRPHLMPLLAVSVDGALHFSAGAGTKKAQNIARNPRCVIAVGGALDVVVEGEASRVQDEGRLSRVAEAYGSRYGWHPEVRDGALWEEGAPTAGPPPYDVYEVVPSKAFGFPGDEGHSPTRWRF